MGDSIFFPLYYIDVTANMFKLENSLIVNFGCSPNENFNQLTDE